MPKNYIHIEPIQRQQRIEILENLSRLEIERSISFNGLIDQGVGKKPKLHRLSFVTAILNKDSHDRIRRLRKKGNTVEILEI